jgi:MFS family permease
MLWQSKVLFVAIPVVLYGILMILVWNRFPKSERVLAGVPYRDMLKEAGTLSWFIVIYMVSMEIARQFDFSSTVTWSVIIVTTVIYFAYTRSLGKPMYIFLLLVMLLLATTELGVDSWVTDLMKPAMKNLGADSGWVLVYTSLIMMILRFCIAPIERRLKPLGVLLVCAVLAAIGLNLLSIAKFPLMILLAATVYGIGKTFFWPVTLGVVSERFPRGGALTLNAVAGVGMLAVGILGAPLLGYIQDTQIHKSMVASGHTSIYRDISVARTSIFGEYQALDGKKEAAVLAGSEFKESVTEAKNTAKAKALRIVSILPAIMAACYLGLILFFKTRGGYKAVELQAATPDE